METSKKVMSVKEVTEYLGVSQSTVYEKCAEGSLPHKRLGGRILIVKKTIDDWLLSDEPNEREVA